MVKLDKEQKDNYQRDIRRDPLRVPDRFVVEPNEFQRLRGYFFLIVGIAICAIGLCCARYCCPRIADREAWSAALLVLFSFFMPGLYIIIIAVRYDLGSSITVDGDVLTVKGRSYKRDCIGCLVCIESQSRSGGSGGFGYNILNRRYQVRDRRGRTVCCVRENHQNYQYLYRWLMRGNCEFKYQPAGW